MIADTARGVTAGRSPAREIGGRDVLLVVMVVVCLELPGLAAMAWGVSVGAMLVLASTPFAVFAAMHARRDLPGLPVLPGLFISGAFGIFFSAGILAWALGGRTSAIGYAYSGDATVATEMMAALAATTTAFVVGEKLRRPPQPVEVRTGFASVVWLSQVLFGLAAVGAVLTVRHLGGWEAAVAQLATHNKEDWAMASGTLGLSLWSVFGLPAMIGVGVSALASEVRRRWRVIAGVEFLLLAVVCIALFGSRLLLTLAAVGIAAGTLGARGVRLRLRTLAVGVAIFLAISGIVLGSRSSDRLQGDGPVRAQLQTLGYAIFDVSFAAWMERDALGPAFRDRERATRIASSVVPGLGPRGASFTDERLDVITVRAVGRASLANTTGLPPSLPTFSLVAFGPIVPVLFALLAGYVVAAGTGVLARRPTAYACFFLGLWYAFLFNDFKGGDLLLDLTAEIRRWSYLGVVIAGVWVMTASWRRRGV